MSKTTFALYSYTTENVGDEIQSIAARYFLPRVDYLIDRDQLQASSPDSPDKVKLIMNAWYMHQPKNWPPRISGLIPLLVSMYVDQKNPAVVKAFTSPKSIEFLKANGPVGARDMATLEFFESIGVPAYFSGCMTLTLQRDKSLPRQDYVLAVDVGPKVADEMRRRTRRPVIEVSVYRSPFMSNEAKFALAEYYLYLYQSAQAVVTTRLHAMLPSLAFETPVLLIKEKGKYEPKRYKGLVDLVRSADVEEFMNDQTLFNLDKPTPNSSEYMKLRRSLINTCEAFTGYSNPSNSFRTLDLETMYKNPHFMAFLTGGIRDGHRNLLLRGDVNWLSRVVNVGKKDNVAQQRIIEERDARVQELEQQIAELQKFKEEAVETFGWKVNTTLHKIRTKFSGRHGDNHEG